MAFISDGETAHELVRALLDEADGSVAVSDREREMAGLSPTAATSCRRCSTTFPLTALALRQGGYDWSLLAYAVGFGGSMIWFGSSAGVGLTGLFPEARSIKVWVRQGWTSPLAYVAGFLAMLAVFGWSPD